MYSESNTTVAASPRMSSRKNHQLQLRTALADLKERTGFPIVFGGFIEKEHIVVSQILGNRGDTLRGLTVRTGWGLGGRVLQEGRPRLTANYGQSRNITHEYDRPVLAEGITTLFATPVTVGHSVHAVLYGGLRTSLSMGGVSIDPAVAVARSLAAKLADTSGAARIASDDEDDPLHERISGSAILEEFRYLYAEVRSITAGLSDPILRAQLEAIQGRMAKITNGDMDIALTPLDRDRRLTARESDVLSLVALGYTNAVVGDKIGVTESTVKSYMNSTMRKLGAATRYEAVAVARKLHLLP